MKAAGGRCFVGGCGYRRGMTSTAVSTPEPAPPGVGGIVALVEQYVRLTPLGDHQLRGDCPFCRSRMFRVRPVHNTFHCFACGEGCDPRAFAAKVGHRP
jgi:hypothetical protein